MPLKPHRKLSVVVAGATGATGSHLVSQLIAHPQVARVVALSRQDVSFEKWPLVFPDLRMADALRQLSVVAVDWEKLVEDSKVITSAAERHHSDKNDSTVLGESVSTTTS